MAVNLLPQAAPQTHADPRAASKVEETANDAPSFSATLSAVANAHAPKAPHANAGTTPTPRDEVNEAKPAHVISQEELAALLMSGAAPASIEPTLVNTSARREPASQSAPEGGDKPVATALAADMPAVIAPIIAALTPAIAISTPAPSTGPAPREVADVIAPPSESKAGPRTLGDRAPPEASASEPAEVPAKVASAKDAFPAMRETQEQKPLRAVDTVTTPSVNDARAVASPPPPPPVQITVATPAFTPAWRDEVTQQLAQLVVMRQDRAEIRLHPADLGPISVQIQMDGGQANLLIQAPQPATRDGLELALPQLRDSLAQQGITLGETSIRDQRDPNPQPGDRPSPYAAASTRDAATPIEAPVRVRLGLVDLFA